MIQGKSFYLKVRKANTRWGCSCCQAVGRDLTTKQMHRVIAKLIKRKDIEELKLIEKIENIEAIVEQE